LIKAGAFKIKAKVNNNFTNWGILWGKLVQENWKPLFQILLAIDGLILPCKKIHTLNNSII
jgi:hypothetical protein